MKKILILILTLTLSTYEVYGQATVGMAISDQLNAQIANKLATDAAAKAAETATQAGIANTADGKVKEKMCGAGNMLMCTMAVLAAAQVVLSIADYFKSKKAQDESACQGSFCENTSGSQNSNSSSIDPYTFATTETDSVLTPLLTNAQRSLNNLKAKGYELNEDGSVNTPNGTMTPAQISAAADSMSASDKAKLADAQQAALDEGAKAAALFSDGNSETGGGKKKSASGGGGNEASGFDMNAYLRSLNAAQEKRGVAGLSVKMGTDNVGVRESNIFEQISAAYSKDPILKRGDLVGP